MATVSLPVRQARRPSRPGVWRLLVDQLGYALRDLWRTRIVFVFTFPLVRNRYDDGNWRLRVLI